MKECVFAASCGQTQYSHNVTLFSFPKEATLLKKWIDFVRVFLPTFNGIITTSSAVCSQHFLDTDFFNKKQYDMSLAVLLKLRPGAVPSLYVQRENDPLLQHVVADDHASVSTADTTVANREFVKNAKKNRGTYIDGDLIKRFMINKG